MSDRFAKFMLPLACAFALVAAVTPATAAARLTVGIGDQSPAMFTNPYFTRINLTVARIVVDYNTATMRNKTELNSTRAWVKDAIAAGVQPMVSFTADTGTTSSYVPTTAKYAAAIKVFLRDFPQVKTYAAWNEPDWIYRPRLADNPRLAASYFNTLVSLCHGCTVVAGDLYLPAPQLGPWIRSYKRYLRTRPVAWALHPYYDVRTHRTAQLRTMMRLVSGPIWLTEISGVERRGHWPYRNQSVAAAGRDEQFLFSLPKRFPRITRIYHYQWQGTHPSPQTGWDSGLLYPNGTPRPAYYVVAKAAGKRQ